MGVRPNGSVTMPTRGLAWARMDDEADLVARLQAGDEAAFAELVRGYQPRLLRLAESIVGSRAVAEEVVQDTWLGVVRGVERFEGRSSLKTWLFRILVNRARSAGVKEHRGGSTALGEESLAERFDRSGAWASPPTPWAEQAEDRLFAQALADRVRKLLPALPADQRRVVLLRDVEGLSAADVSELVGITDGNQRVLLHRGRRRLRERLEAEMGTA